MGKPDRLCKHTGQEESGINAMLCEQGQLLYLGNDKNLNESNADDMEVDRMYVSK